MAKLIIEKKINSVQQIVEQLKSAKSFLIFEYLGLTAKRVSDLRKFLHDINAKMYVSKNNILSRALKECGFSTIADLNGPCAIIIAKGDVVSPFKEIHNLSKDFNFIHYKNGLLEGEIITIDKLSAIASLPSRDGLLSMLCSVLTASIRNLAYGLNAVATTKE
jgi:large subunit ribosomal protein L10